MIHKKMAARDSSGGALAYVYRGDGHEHAVDHVYHITDQCISDDPIRRDEDGKIHEIDISGMESELDHLAKKNSRSGLKFAHYVISLPPGERLNKNQWKEVVGRYMEALGYDKTTKWTCALHAEKEHQHVHIVACRVKNDPRTLDPAGKKIKAYNLVGDSNDYQKGMQVMREMEITYGLSRTPDPSDTWGKDEHRADIERMVRDLETGRPTRSPWRSRILGRLHAAVDQSRGKSFTHFLEACRKKGIEPLVRVNDRGYPVGISYSMDGRSESGAELKGTRLTFSALTGMKYDPSSECMQPTHKKNEGIHYTQGRDLKACLETRESLRGIEDFRKTDEALRSLLPYLHELENAPVRVIDLSAPDLPGGADWTDMDGPMTLQNKAKWEAKIDADARSAGQLIEKHERERLKRHAESMRTLLEILERPPVRHIEDILLPHKRKVIKEDIAEGIKPK